MENARYFKAIEKMASEEALFAFPVSSDPKYLTVHLFVSTGEDDWVQLCSFDMNLVVEWVDNGKLEGREHVSNQIAKAKGRLRDHYGSNF